jgi:hypothetical protein
MNWQTNAVSGKVNHKILCAFFVSFVLFVVDFVLSRRVQADLIKPQSSQSNQNNKGG